MGWVGVLTRDSRLSILAIGLLFILGALILARVDIRAGQAAALQLQASGVSPQSE
jgi:UMF1 family MFS transporter